MSGFGTLAHADDAASANNEYVFISDMNYDTEKSYTNWKTIQKDKNTSGEPIQLLVNNEVVQFNKGMGAHADSVLYYDISEYSSIYTQFSAYLGVDYRQAGRDDGVVFYISVSNDGVEWTEKYKSDIIRSVDQAKYVNIDVAGYKYLKLYADDNVRNNNDHSVYADARLMKADYDLSSERLDLKKVAEYDEIISSKYTQDSPMEGELLQLTLERTFVNRYGYNNIQQVASKSKTYKEAIEYIFNNQNVLNYFVTGGEKDGGSYVNVLNAWCKLYQQNKADFENDMYLKMAVSLSIANAQNIVFWTGTGRASEPVTRYEIYKNLITSGKMDQGGSSAEFAALPIELMRWVMNNMIHDDEINWLVNVALERKAKGKSYESAYEYIAYTSGFNYGKAQYHSNELYTGTDASLQGKTYYQIWDEKWNISAFDRYEETGFHRLWMVFQDGSVCGGLAKTYTNLAQVFGKAAAVIGQPGHAASIEYNYGGSHRWTIQNDISGWLGSEKGERMPLGWGSTNWDAYYNVSYVLLAQRAFDDYANLEKAMYYNKLADVFTDNNAKLACYEKALEVQSFNLDAMVGVINCYRADATKTSEDYRNLAERIIEQYKFYPQQMLDVLALVTPYVTDTAHVAQVDLWKSNALIRASQAKAGDCAQPGDTQKMAKALMGKNTTALATFSFDGENAGKIMINDKYDGSDIRVRYSLDNKETWIETNDHVIELTQEQLDSINDTNDIIVGLVGTDATYTIDITKATKPNLSYNDRENCFLKYSAGLMFSTDNGETWCDYNSDIVFEGNQTVQVRYKAVGTRLASDPSEYTFYQDNDAATRKYISVKEIKLDSFSSQQNNTTSAAINMIDGDHGTCWHTTYAGEEYKYYTIKLDRPVYLSAVEYLPGGANGRLRDVSIYTSMDGQTWTTAFQKQSLANNNSWKEWDFAESTPALYVKIVADKTWGNSEWEQNRYFSGYSFNFFEDTTKDFSAEPTIAYSTEDLTNQDVVATVTLPAYCTALNGTEYTFAENGSYTFKYLDAYQQEKELVATVTNIDKEAPAAEVVYDVTDWTNQAVTATLVNANEDIVITNLEGTDTYTFTENNTYTFTFEDAAGNVGTATAEVTWIDPTKPEEVVTFTAQEDGVLAHLNVNPEYVEILNNEGSPDVVFTENGEFIFELRLQSGYEFTYTVTVDNLNMDTEEPVVTPEPTEAPEATEEPVATPEPTVEPTATPEPTVEPTATPEPTAAPTATPKPNKPSNSVNSFFQGVKDFFNQIFNKWFRW